MGVFKRFFEFRQTPQGEWIGFEPAQPAFDYPRYAKKTGTIYVIEAMGFYKIGLTTNFPKRFNDIDAGIPAPVTKIAIRNVPLAGLALCRGVVT